MEHAEKIECPAIRKPGPTFSIGTWAPAYELPGIQLVGRFSSRFALLIAFGLTIAHADVKLPKNPIDGDPVNDLPAPSSLQALAVKRTIAITWDWQPPEQQPLFTAFGYEVQRNDGRTAIVADKSITDLDLEFGTYTYRVRARGEAKFKGRRVTHISDWSEEAAGIIRAVCSDAPQITLLAQPTEHGYSSIPKLRLRLVGDVKAPPECHLSPVTYHVDSGTGITHSGPLKTDAHGHFDSYINAITPDDEVPSGTASFTITATVEDEAGPNTSPAYTIGMERSNPYAPH